VQAPGGFEDFKHAGWVFEFDRGSEGEKFKLDETLNSEALLMGADGASDLRDLCRTIEHNEWRLRKAASNMTSMSNTKVLLSPCSVGGLT
jgi:hypothetical protein